MPFLSYLSIGKYLLTRTMVCYEEAISLYSITVYTSQWSMHAYLTIVLFSGLHHLIPMAKLINMSCCQKPSFMI